MNTSCDVAFSQLRGEIRRDSRQEVADTTIRISNLMQPRSVHENELTIVRNLPTLRALWDFVSHDERRAMLVDIKGTKRKLQSLIDLVIKPILGQHASLVKWGEAFVSKYFLIFIQGITLFRSNEDAVVGRPAYHRATSCGPADGGPEYVERHLDCRPATTDIQELRRRRRNAWNCLVERKVYEALYMDVMSVVEQDFGHRYHLKHFERDVFQTCFPLMYVTMGDTDIKWSNENGHVPLTLTLSYDARNTTDGPFDHVIEEYTRKYVGGTYELGVTCKKTVVQADGTSTTAFKTQSFFKENPEWVSRIGVTEGGGKGTTTSDPWLTTTRFTTTVKVETMAKACRERARRA